MPPRTPAKKAAKKPAKKTVKKAAKPMPRATATVRMNAPKVGMTPRQKQKWLPDNTLNLMIDFLTKPEATFKKELPNATYKKAFGFYGIYMGIIGFLVGLVVSLAGVAFGPLIMAEPEIAMFMPLIFGAWLWLPILLILLSWLGLIINNIIFYVFAMLLGGKGSFEEQRYLFTLYVVPIHLLSLLLSWVPLIGIIILLYAFYVFTMSIKVAHRLTTGRAILVWLLPVLIVLFAIVFFISFMFSAASAGGFL